MSDKEEDVFLDANSQEDDSVPRRSSRKRRSTAGSLSASSKKAKPTKMPLSRSPGSSGTAKRAPPDKPVGAAVVEPAHGMDEFWTRMTTMLSGTEARMTNMIGGSEARLKAETTVVRQALERKLDGVAATVDGLKERMNSHESRMNQIEGNIADLIGGRIGVRGSERAAVVDPRGGGEDEGEEDEEEVVHKAWGSPRAGTSYASVAKTVPKRQMMRAVIDPAKKREDDYWRCRKAVRIRPVKDGIDKEALRDYLEGALGMSQSSIEALGMSRIVCERIPYGPKSKHQKEMVVWFPTTEARDVVKASARNLANLGSEYGVRLELPNHLKSAIQALQSLSYDIKQKHPKARRMFFLTIA